MVDVLLILWDTQYSVVTYRWYFGTQHIVMVGVLLILWSTLYFDRWRNVDTVIINQIFISSSYCLYCPYTVFGHVDTTRYPVFRYSILAILAYWGWEKTHERVQVRHVAPKSVLTVNPDWVHTYRGDNHIFWIQPVNYHYIFRVKLLWYLPVDGV